jgi:predicted cupin superfamily sugar epimerase
LCLPSDGKYFLFSAKISGPEKEENYFYVRTNFTNMAYFLLKSSSICKYHRSAWVEPKVLLAQCVVQASANI